MTKLLESGMAWLADQGAEHLSVEVTYTRDGVGSVTFDATPGSQLLRVTDAQGNTKVKRPDRDFGFRASDLVLNGLQVTPRDGDHIDVSFDDGVTTERYDAAMPQPGEACWRYSDSFKKRIRVHTKGMGPSPIYIVDRDSVNVADEDGVLAVSV